jgi:hypothetical protein
MPKLEDVTLRAHARVAIGGIFGASLNSATLNESREESCRRILKNPPPPAAEWGASVRITRRGFLKD